MRRKHKYHLDEIRQAAAIEEFIMTTQSTTTKEALEPPEQAVIDTIMLHPNDDGTYRWTCPNCKREDLGLSSETDLTGYLPNVTCPNCGFQFAVDKRYLQIGEMKMTNSATNAASNQTRCSKCGHDAFNGRYCEADDPAFQTRKVPCGCVCQFPVTNNQQLGPFLCAAKELQEAGLLWSSEAAEELGGEPFDPAQQILEVAYILHRTLDSRVSAPIVAPEVDAEMESVDGTAAEIKRLTAWQDLCFELLSEIRQWVAPGSITDTDAPRVLRAMLGERARLRAAASTVAPVEQSDDGWVTFGRVKVDIENETETFERIDPPVAPASPAALGDEAERRKAAIALLDEWLRQPVSDDDSYGDELRRLIDENRLSDRKFWPELTTTTPPSTRAKAAAEEIFELGKYDLDSTKAKSQIAAIIERHFAPLAADSDDE